MIFQTGNSVSAWALISPFVKGGEYLRKTFFKGRSMQNRGEGRQGSEKIA